MNPIIMQIKTRLAVEKRAFQEEELKMIRAMNELSSYVNPFFGEDLDSIKADEIEQVGDEIKVLKEKLKTHKLNIKRMVKELGE